MTNIHLFKDELFFITVADSISRVLRLELAENKRASLVLAGGTTPKGVYGELARLQDIDWNRIDLFWGDERWVPHADPRSNYLMVEQALLRSIRIPHSNIYAVDTQLETSAHSAAAYGEQVERYLERHQRFSLVLLGLGDDGHYASVFPNSSAVEEQERSVIALAHPTDGTERITITPPQLLGARHIKFMVNGSGKQSIVGRILRQGDKSLPAHIFVDRPNVQWLISHSAWEGTCCS